MSLKNALISGAVLGLLLPLSTQLPGWVRWWAEELSPRLMWAAGWACSASPLSVAEIGIGAGLLMPAAVWLRRARGVRRLSAELAVLAVWLWVSFYAGWGLNYARAPLGARLGLDVREETTTEELVAVGGQLLALSVRHYRAVHGGDDGGAPTAMPPMAEVNRHLEAAYAAMQGRFGLEPAVAWERPPPKAMVASALLTRIGILGFFSPFTGEANLHGWAPAQSLGHAIAHEKAHQRGIAPEDEANYVGFLAAATAEDPFLRYSAYLFAYKQVLSQLAEMDEAAVMALREGEVPGIRRDFQDAWQFWHAHEGLLREAGRAINDTYLKVNGQEGTVTYNHSLRLLLAWARLRGGRVEL